MKRIFCAALLVAVLPLHAEDAPSADTRSNEQMLQAAFDGAMTCSAVTAIAADDDKSSERWRWENRSFAFGMLAAKFWNDARQTAMTAEDLNKALNSYAGALLEMKPEERERYATQCGEKYADIDKLCETNPCVHKGPAAADAAASPAPTVE